MPRRMGAFEQFWGTAWYSDHWPGACPGAQSRKGHGSKATVFSFFFFCRQPWAHGSRSMQTHKDAIEELLSAAEWDKHAQALRDVASTLIGMGLSGTAFKSVQRAELQKALRDHVEKFLQDRVDKDEPVSQEAWASETGRISREVGPLQCGQGLVNARRKICVSYLDQEVCLFAKIRALDFTWGCCMNNESRSKRRPRNATVRI